MTHPADNDKPSDAYVELVLAALAVISKVVGGATAQSAAGAVTVIRVVLHSIDEARFGKVTPEVARAALDKLKMAIRDNDAVADATLADKFKSKSGI